MIEEKIFNIDNFSLALTAKTSYQISKLKFEDLLKIYDNSQTKTINYHSNGWGIEPGVAIGYAYACFIIRLEASYQFSFAGTFSLGNNELINISETLSEVKPEWDCFKTGIALGINI